ncbi:MAG: CpaF family protein, partial [Bdellovibrionales bacterium]|nr:CpaF family protein [Oligoflexia bacterium]
MEPRGKREQDDEKTDSGMGAFPPLSTQSNALSNNRPVPDFGLLNSVLQDAEVTEIMVNDLRNIAIEKRGQIIVTPIRFKTLYELNRVVSLLLEPSGKVLSADQPFAVSSLPDGSRVHVAGPPVTEFGPCITIRRFPKRYSIENFVTNGTLDARMAHFLSACVAGRQNILISGGTGTGKTTILNSLIALIPPHERVITIEDTAEIPLILPNQVKMMTRAKSAGTEAITARDLVANSLRMRPDRIIVGECRGSEAMDMIQAMNTGHQGSMTTIHANSPRDALFRLETLMMTSGLDLPLGAIRRQIASAVQLIVQIRRFRSGARKIISIQEVTGTEQDTLLLQEVFLFESTQAGDSHSDLGNFRFNVSAKVIEALKMQGIKALP